MGYAVANYDFVFLHLKLVNDERDHPLKDRFERFALDVKADLQSPSINLKRAIQAKLSIVFDIRLDAIRALTKEEVDIINAYSSKVFPYFEELKAVRNYSSLAENLIIAFSLNKTVVESILRKTDFSARTAQEYLPNISFDQLQTAIYFGNPNNEIANAVVDWIKCSLFMEYIAIATFTMYENRFLVSQEKINELSNILEETIFAYAALATEFNIISYPENLLNLPRSSSKGTEVFKRMLEEKNMIHRHLQQGGTLSDLKDRFSFGSPLRSQFD